MGKKSIQKHNWLKNDKMQKHLLNTSAEYYLLVKLSRQKEFSRLEHMIKRVWRNNIYNHRSSGYGEIFWVWFR